jgi:hypothetical protein
MAQQGRRIPSSLRILQADRSSIDEPPGDSWPASFLSDAERTACSERAPTYTSSTNGPLRITGDCDERAGSSDETVSVPISPLSERGELPAVSADYESVGTLSSANNGQWVSVDLAALKGGEIERIMKQLEVLQRLADVPQIVGSAPVILTGSTMHIGQPPAIAGVPLPRLLAEHGGRLPAVLAVRVFRELVRVVAEVHARGVALGALALHAVRVAVHECGAVSLALLGSKDMVDAQATPVCLRASFSAHIMPVMMPPEMVAAPAWDAKMADMWQLGVALYVLCTGACPLFEVRKGEGSLVSPCGCRLLSVRGQ